MQEEYIEPSITYKSVQRQPKRVLQADYLRSKGRMIDGVLHLPVGICADDYDGLGIKIIKEEKEPEIVPLEELEEFNIQQHELEDN